MEMFVLFIIILLTFSKGKQVKSIQKFCEELRHSIYGSQELPYKILSPKLRQTF